MKKRRYALYTISTLPRQAHSSSRLALLLNCRTKEDFRMSLGVSAGVGAVQLCIPHESCDVSIES